MGEIEETIKEVKEKIEDLKKRDAMQKRLEKIRGRLDKLENEPGKRKSLDGCYDIEKGEILWPSFEGLFEGPY